MLNEDEKKKKWIAVSKVSWVVFILTSLILLTRTAQIAAFYYMYWDNSEGLVAPTYPRYMIWFFCVQVVSLILGIYANRMKKH